MVTEEDFDSQDVPLSDLRPRETVWTGAHDRGDRPAGTRSVTRRHSEILSVPVTCVARVVRRAMWQHWQRTLTTTTTVGAVSLR